MDFFPQLVREFIEYLEKLTYKNAMGFCPQLVRESVKHFEELPYKKYDEFLSSASM